MIKKSIIFFVIVFVSFFIYQKKLKNSNLEIWDLVPAKSVMIIEINNPLEKWNKFSSSVNEDQFRDFRKLIDKNISELNSFLNDKLNVLVDNNNLIVSVSKTSKEGFDFLFTSNCKNLDFQYILKKAKDSLSFDITTRDFNDEKIYDFSDGTNIFSVVILNNFISLSKNTLLIEDVIRTSQNKNLSFKYINQDLFNQVMVQNDFGNIFLNFTELSNSFENHKYLFDQLPKSTFFDLNLNENNFYLSGFSNISEEYESSVKIEDNQMMRILPNNTVVFNNSIKTNQKNEKYEVGRLSFLSNYSNVTNKIIIFKKTDNSIIELIKNEVDEKDKINKIKNDSIYLMLRDLEYDHKNLYVFEEEKYLFISSEYNSLKEYIESKNNGDYWRKDLNFSKLLSILNRNQNKNILINFKEFLKNYPLISNAFSKEVDMLSIQRSDVNNKYYTTLNFNSNSTEYDQVNNNILSFNADNNLILKPHIFLSHVNNLPQVIINDENNFIYHLDNKLKEIWRDSIDSEIISEIFTIDYYNNRKKQILFATKNKVYCYDRLGNILPGFPINNPHPSGYIQDINVIDYDNSKRYRISISSENKAFLIDKYGKNLKGWDPLIMEDRIIQAPKHFRLNGKDYILISLENGKVYLKNRRGFDYDGFPVKLDNNISEEIYIDLSQNFRNSNLIALDNLGITYFVGLDGKIKKQNQIFRRSRNSNFKMLVDPRKRSYQILSVDENVIYNNEKTMNFKNNRDFDYQFYNFGDGDSFTIITDPINKKSYTFDTNFNTKFKNISNQNRISILKSKGVYSLYTTFNNTISVIEIKN